MTDLDRLISVHGENYTVNQVSDGSADSYGDLTPTWSAAATEKVWLQDPSVKSLKIIEAVVGKLDAKDYVAFLLSDSIVVQGDVLACVSDSIRYDVRRIWTSQLFGTDSHKIAVLRKSEDA